MSSDRVEAILNQLLSQPKCASMSIISRGALRQWVALLVNEKKLAGIAAG